MMMVVWWYKYRFIYNVGFYLYFKPSMFDSIELFRLLTLGFFDSKPSTFAFPP